jgi:hypothetical protein
MLTATNQLARAPAPLACVGSLVIILAIIVSPSVHSPLPVAKLPELLRKS